VGERNANKEEENDRKTDTRRHEKEPTSGKQILNVTDYSPESLGVTSRSSTVVLCSVESTVWQRARDDLQLLEPLFCRAPNSSRRQHGKACTSILSQVTGRRPPMMVQPQLSLLNKTARSRGGKPVVMWSCRKGRLDPVGSHGAELEVSGVAPRSTWGRPRQGSERGHEAGRKHTNAKPMKKARGREVQREMIGRC
ncbi:hypothetical protein NDU88_002982, partial [Pleurodeles waltl]